MFIYVHILLHVTSTAIFAYADIAWVCGVSRCCGLTPSKDVVVTGTFPNGFVSSVSSLYRMTCL